MKRKRYDDKFRGSAVVMLQSQGYPDSKGSLQRVADALGIPARTLSRWANGESNPPPDNVVSNKKNELADIFEDLARKMLSHAGRDNIIEEMSGKDATIAAATAVDKMRLLKGLPTEIVEVIPDFIAALRDIGKDPRVFMDRVIERAGNERIH